MSGGDENGADKVIGGGDRRVGEVNGKTAGAAETADTGDCMGWRTGVT